MFASNFGGSTVESYIIGIPSWAVPDAEASDGGEDPEEPEEPGEPTHAAVGAPVAVANTWQSTGSITVPDVAVGDSVLVVVSVDEGSGDGDLDTITSTVLGVALTHLFSTPVIESGTRRIRQHYYVA